MAAVLKQALTADEPPCIAELAKRLDVGTAALYEQFPKQVAKLSARYQAFKRQSSIRRKLADSEAVRQTANRLHKEGKYPSVRRVLAELGWKRSRDKDTLVRRALSEVRKQLCLDGSRSERKA